MNATKTSIIPRAFKNRHEKERKKCVEDISGIMKESYMDTLQEKRDCRFYQTNQRRIKERQWLKKND